MIVAGASSPVARLIGARLLNALALAATRLSEFLSASTCLEDPLTQSSRLVRGAGPVVSAAIQARVET